MNKIISILAVVALIVAMAVPVFASEYSYNGVQLASVAPILTANSSYNYAYINYGAIDDGQGYRLWLLTNVENATYTDANGLQPVMDGGVQFQRYNYINGEWVFAKESGLTYIAGTPIWATFDIYKDGNILLNASLCDGSTCPASDVNQDNVCDDCGMTFAVLRDYGPPDPYTVWTESKQELYPYALIYTDNSGNDWLILSKNPATASDGAITISTGSHARYSVFGTSWNLVGSYDEYSTYGNIAEVYPSYNICNESGSIEYPYNGDFFPLPLWTQMQMVTQGEMGQLILETVGTTKVLVLCGVGLMALLVGLSLFGKRSLISLR